MSRTDQMKEQVDKLIELAEDRGIRCVEARGLDTRRGVRFSRDGQEWIAFASELSFEEKARVIGFLLESTPVEAAVRAGLAGVPSGEIVHTLCC